MNYIIPTAYQQKAVSANVQKKNTGVALGTGDANSDMNGQSLLENRNNLVQKYGTDVGIAVEVASSGNFGAIKAISGNARKHNTEGVFIGKRFSGSINNVLLGGGSDVSIYRANKGWYGYQRYAITATSIHGVVTKGSNAGATVLASGVDGTVGFRADHASNLMSTDLVPGELTTFTAALNVPSQLNYDDRTNAG